MCQQFFEEEEKRNEVGVEERRGKRGGVPAPERYSILFVDWQE